MIATQPAYLTLERAIERLTDLANEARAAHDENDLELVLDISRRAIGMAHHAAYLARKEIEAIA